MSAVMTRALPSGMVWWQMDNRYWLPTLEDFQQLLVWDPTEHWEYLVDRFDCESFAFQLQANFVARLGLNCVGVVLDKSSTNTLGQPNPHAYNMIVLADGSFRFLEPQEDRYVDIGTGLYRFEAGVILL